MGLKLYKRNITIQNVLIVLVFSLFFLHILYAFKNGESAFNRLSFFYLLKDKWPITILFFLSFISVFFVRVFSKYLLFLFFTGIFGLSLYLFFEDFNKIILFLTLIYFFVTFYFLGLWNRELEEAVYTPNFSLNDVEIRPPFAFNVCLETEEGQTIAGNLTNWNRSGLFFISRDDIPHTKKPIRLRVNFEDIEFEEVGHIVTRFGKGAGIRFNDNDNSDNFLGWKDFYKIIDDRGYRSKG
ncbi:MAG: hypothetical protein DRQ88_02540 [Epsilonproteobacteria bacterium]|nr:MAG: hypothetical protein DRQ89_02315 [Campylobacterota bacterium]RLA67546.1 MAG: hypothetical protein DRQ88_02540 [Campylobacterota bacterium]